MSLNLHFSLAIPHGWRLWVEDVQVVGILLQIADVKKFAHGRKQELQLEQTPVNNHDPSSIKVIGLYKSWFLNCTGHIGFLPEEYAEIMARKNISGFLPCLRSIWIGDRSPTDVAVRFDILEITRSRSKW